MDIEAVAEKTPELIFTETIDPALGSGFQARRTSTWVLVNGFQKW